VLLEMITIVSLFALNSLRMVDHTTITSALTSLGAIKTSVSLEYRKCTSVPLGAQFRGVGSDSARYRQRTPTQLS